MLRPLLEHLTRHMPDTDEQWQGWHVAPVRGGMNSLLYHVTRPEANFAVKLTVKDERNRAAREYRALECLRDAGLSIAPLPVFLDTTTYPQQVIVQTWLEGEVNTDPPTTDSAWDAMLRHYATIHALTPAADMPQAVVNFETATDGLASLSRQIERLPEPPAALDRLWQRARYTDYSTWPPVKKRLARTDPNPSNFIRCPAGWASVDWENSGWGDPAFELADMLIHPQYMSVSAERRAWVIDRYCALTRNPSAVQRIDTYYRILTVWWVARMARYLYEIPLGLDPRLTQRPEGWQAEMQAKYDHYLRLAESFY